MSWLDQLFGPEIDSAKQLEDAKAGTPAYDAKLEREAKSLGFKSAQELMLFEKNRRKGGNKTVSKAANGAGVAKEAVGRGDAMAWHPMNMLDSITEAIKNAGK